MTALITPSVPKISNTLESRIRDTWYRLTPDEQRRALHLIQAHRDYPLAYPTLAYIPHEKPLSFHLAPNKGRGLFGGNRSGMCLR